MESIPEEDQDLSPQSPFHTTLHEKKSRFTEVYTSEEVDTLVSKIPLSAIPESWNLANGKELFEPSNTHMSEAIAGPTSAKGSTYSYSYESHYDDPIDEEINGQSFKVVSNNGERPASQTQKITRVTKVTTTRSLRQLPLNSMETEYYFDADGNPLPVSSSTDFYENGKMPYSDNELSSFGINLALSHDQNEAYEVDDKLSTLHDASLNTLKDSPSAPGIPKVTEISDSEIEVSWTPPQYNGEAGPVVGYLVKMRELGTTNWHAVHEGLIIQNFYHVTNLNLRIEYEIQITAVHRSGPGVPSIIASTAQSQIESDSKRNQDVWNVIPPGRPYVTQLDVDRVAVEWSPAIADPNSAPVSGYVVRYRSSSNSDWLQSADNFITECATQVSNLKANSEYDFQVVALSANGCSAPSLSSGFIRLGSFENANVLQLEQPQVHNLSSPGQPQIDDFNSNWVRLFWSASGPVEEIVSYIVEYRDISDPVWYIAATDVVTTSYTVECLRSDSDYEFRVIACGRFGSVSVPSAVSATVKLRSSKKKIFYSVPPKPEPPEYIDFDGGDRVTLCWNPTASNPPVQGYDVEFKDYQQDAEWYKMNESLLRSCKMTVGYLIFGHEYQFRIIASNSCGQSEPSDPSSLIQIKVPASCNGSYIETATFGSVPLLQDEFVRESPPLPDRDDSPPPIHRKFMRERNGLHWRDPTLREVIEYLDSTDKIEQLNASGYLQHLTFNDNAIKEETRDLDGIPKLVRLLDSDVPEIQKNSCGCLKNLSFGKENDTNKRAIDEAGGIFALASLLQRTHDIQVMEEVTATLWNLSSCDDLKAAILDKVARIISERVVVPGSGLFPNGSDKESRFGVPLGSNMFKNGTGVLRNVSAASHNVRKVLFGCTHLVDSLLHYLTHAVLTNHVDNGTVENVICILRNLSYRIQEVSAESMKAISVNDRERSKSAPSGSPKSKKKDVKKKAKNRNDAAFISQTQLELVKICLKLLQEAANPETLEASAGTIQNLAASQSEPSMEVRTCVRVSKGLPILVELLRLNNDRVVCAVTTALRNLAVDERNRELIGKYAVKDLVAKLPRSGSSRQESDISSATIGAILGILFEIVRHSADFTKSIHECGGTERFRFIASSYPQYSARICKYASQVLYVMWQHKELHDLFKRSNLKESDFYSGTARARDATTLSRPISSQGAERPSNLNYESFCDNVRAFDVERYDTLDSRPTEPLYALISKHGIRQDPKAEDSWV